MVSCEEDKKEKATTSSEQKKKARVNKPFLAFDF